MNDLINRRSRRPGAVALAVLLYSFFLSLPIHAFNNHEPFDISADAIDYVDDTQEIIASGHVVIVQSSSTLHADLLRYDRIHRRLFARGKVILREKGQLMLGDQLDYDLVAEKGEVLGGKGDSGSWRYQGTSWEKYKDYYIGRMGSFTSCDLIDPHYHIRASRVHLIPDRLFWSWNNRFYADETPVMYTPFMYKFLDEQRITFQAQPGNDSLNGAFAKTTTTIRIKDKTYDKFYWDYYTQAGNGYGNELDFQDTNYKGSLFGYFIDPHPSVLLPGQPTGTQYNARGYLWQQVSKTVQLQANANLRQNISFNTQYFAQDPNQSQNDILSSIALTQQTTTYNQHLVVQREDAPDAADTGPFATVHMQNASIPSYTFTLFSKPLWSPKVSPVAGPVLMGLQPGTTTLVTLYGPVNQGSASRPYGPLTQDQAAAASVPLTSIPKPSKIGPLLFSMNGGAQDVYQRSDNQTHTGANTSFSLTQSFPFSRDMTFNTGVTPQINYQDKGPTTNFSTDTQKGYTGRTTFSNGMRWRPISSLSIDAGHTLTERFKPNALTFARDSTDHGVETNSMGLSANLRPSSKVLFRTSSAFDFRRLDDESLLDYEQRKWAPWATDLTYTPSSNWEHYLSNQIGHYPFRTNSWQVSTTYKGIHRTAITTAFLYNRSSPGEVTWNQSFGYYFGPGWRLDAGFNALVPAYSLETARNANLINTQLILLRDMHCWQTQFIYRDTPPFSREYSILFSLKLGGPAAQPIADQNLEAQFYPWRAAGPDPSIR